MATTSRYDTLNPDITNSVSGELLVAGGEHLAAYDGNGNVVGLVSPIDGTRTAEYEYNPFGGTLRATGSACDSNPFRFSTKYTDDETGLLYYGHRYYNPREKRME